MLHYVTVDRFSPADPDARAGLVVQIVNKLVLVKQETMRTETGGPYASREDAVKAALKAAMATGTCICVECIVDDYFHRHHMIPYDQFSFALRFIMLCHSQEFPTLHGSIEECPQSFSSVDGKN